MKKILALLLILSFLILTITVIYGERTMNTDLKLKTIKDLTPQITEKFSKFKIFFAHQSVGKNITDGLKNLTKKVDSLQINFKESKNPDIITEKPLFMHCRIGANRRPLVKLNEFAEILRAGVAEKIDIALFKLCYADIMPDTDIKSLIKEVKNTFAELKQKYPDKKFIICTVPLYKQSPFIKALIKRILNRDKNLNRNRFNDLIRSSFTEKEYFDLALFESLAEDGRVVQNSRNNPALAPEYTSDGGHLNSKGSEMIAVRLIMFLGNLKQ